MAAVAETQIMAAVKIAKILLRVSDSIARAKPESP
jgi:hypothetical protein